LTCSRELDEQAFVPIRARMALDHAKWDPRIGDTETLARFTLVLTASLWSRLARLAERLAAEASAAEEELLANPALIVRLGLPRPIAANFHEAAQRRERPSPTLARMVRFDFHPTTEGWKISEANADVPGGHAEASELPRLMAQHCLGLRPIGHPGEDLARSIRDVLGSSARVALVSAPGYLEDLQVTAYLAERLRQVGADPLLLQPDHVRWEAGRAMAIADWCRGPIDGLVRFYQGEWLARGPRRRGWGSYFFGGVTPTCNPGSALLIESKRFPLTWPRLSTPLTTWKALLPETVDPRQVLGRERDGCVLKEAFSNTGDSIAWPGSADGLRWEVSLWRARLRPSRWVAQRRFGVLPLETPIGPRYPCLGIYTINGRASGVYGRLSPRPLIDYRATDVAVLVREDET
jgi:hypothetical protein